MRDYEDWRRTTNAFSRQQKIAELDAHNARQLARIAKETGDHLPAKRLAGATPGGDERQLRGIPALARGVGGAINGTRPDGITNR